MTPLLGNRAWPLSPVAIDHVVAATGQVAALAALDLQTALLDGRVAARGPLTGDHAEVVPAEFWRFALPHPDGSARGPGGLPMLPWFEVDAAAILKIWPLPAPKNRRAAGQGEINQALLDFAVPAGRPVKQSDAAANAKLDALGATSRQKIRAFRALPAAHRYGRGRAKSGN